MATETIKDNEPKEKIVRYTKLRKSSVEKMLREKAGKK
jgi:hypothetical protein